MYVCTVHIHDCMCVYIFIQYTLVFNGEHLIRSTPIMTGRNVCVYIHTKYIFVCIHLYDVCVRIFSCNVQICFLYLQDTFFNEEHLIRSSLIGIVTVQNFSKSQRSSQLTVWYTCRPEFWNFFSQSPHKHRERHTANTLASLLLGLSAHWPRPKAS